MNNGVKQAGIALGFLGASVVGGCAKDPTQGRLGKVVDGENISVDAGIAANHYEDVFDVPADFGMSDAGVDVVPDEGVDAETADDGGPDQMDVVDDVTHFTRGELAMLLVDFLDLECVEPYDVYPDVTADHPAYGAISCLSDKEMVNGYPDGNFKPERSVNRAQFAKIIYHLLEKEFYFEMGLCDGVDNPFEDVEELYWFYHYVMCLLQLDLIDADDEYRPEENLSEGEAEDVLVKVKHLIQ